MCFITSLMYVLFSFLFGLLLIGTALQAIDLNSLGELASGYINSNFSSQAISTLVGALIILLSLRYIQSSIIRNQRAKSISFDSANGRVDITVVAIEEMLKKMLEDSQGLAQIKPRINLNKKFIDVTISASLTSQVNILQLTEEIQGQVKDKLLNLLGEDQEIEVAIKIQKIFCEEKKQLAETEPEVPFRNF